MTWDEFATVRVDVGEANLAVRVGGAGPPVVLLHGFPQHSLMWHAVAPILADRFTVITPDQRGMGASTVAEANYSKTALAGDLVKVLDALGHERAHVAGYDLGAGVAVAFARDHPERVQRLAVMEFVPAGFGLEHAMAPQPGWNANSNWHFSVFAAPDVAVWLFAGRERELLEWFFWHETHAGALVVSEEHIAAYARALSRPGVLRAGANYYASIFQDAVDNEPLKNRPLAMPVLAIGGASHAGPMMEKLWGGAASDLITASIPAAGHWLGDENPAATATALADFFAADQEQETAMADQKSVLIIGETPEKIDFSDPAIPKGMTPEKIRNGLEQSLNDLREKGHVARLVYLDDEQSAPRQLREALGWETFDVIVVGAGLRIVPKQTLMFEIVMNIVHGEAPQARIAFNIAPDDSANAAERVLADHG